MSIIAIQIKNWEKYNPRTDRKKHTWFRLENNIATDPKFFGLSISQKFITICIFAEASKEAKNGAASIFVDWLADNLKIKEIEITKTIQGLERLGILTVTTGNQSVSTGSTTDVTNDTLRTDVTNDTNERTVAPSDESLRAEATRLFPNEYSEISEILEDRKVTVKLAWAWFAAFPDKRWVMGEIRKGLTWEAANPQRKKKDFGKFMTNWMNKGWDQRKHPTTGVNQAQQRFEGTKDALNQALENIGAEKV